jgi:hypothetical protein
MNIDGIDPSQIESLRTPFLERPVQEPIREARPEEVKAETAKVELLAQQARELPENRPEVIARGRELFSNPSYPSADVEEGVARILLGLQEEAY